MKANELEEYSAKELDRLARERDEAIKAKRNYGEISSGNFGLKAACHISVLCKSARPSYGSSPRFPPTTPTKKADHGKAI